MNGRWRASLLTAALMICAGSVGAAEPASLRPVDVWALRVDEGSDSEIHLPTKEGFQPLRVSGVQPSGPLRVLVRDTVPVYLRRLQIDPETGAPPPPDRLVAVSREAASVLLLSKDGETGPQFSAISYIPPREGRPGWLFFNMTGHTVVLRVGEEAEPFSLAPGTMHERSIPGRVNRGTAVTAMARIEGEPRIFYSTYWPVREGRRGMVLFLPDGSERIGVRMISERLLSDAGKP